MSEKICKYCNSSFKVLDEDLDLYREISPVVNDQKFLSPTPDLCVDCRFQRRMAFRNERSLYKNKSSLSGKPLISIYSPDKSYTILSFDEWWSDDWSALDYGRDFDFERGFFEQFEELYRQVPHINLIQDGSSENCEYTNYGAANKNCYLTTGYKCEDVYFSDALSSKDCCDCLMVVNGEKLYECIDCDNCYNSVYLLNCNNCRDSYFLESCNSCTNCLGCKNLKHKEYHIFNKPYSRDEYQRLFETYQLHTNEGLEVFLKKFDEFRSFQPFLYTRQKRSLNSIGDVLDGAKNCYYCFKVVDNAENCRYCYVLGLGAHHCIDCGNCGGSYCCGADGIVGGQNIYFSHFIRQCSEIMYSAFCYNSQNLFGCIGLNRKQYCIFNKQYSKDEYFEKLKKILSRMQETGEWGSYFPPEISPFGYNESYAYDLYPLTRKMALEKGFKWSDYLIEISEKPFKLTEIEKMFYEKMNLPHPLKNPRQRIFERVQRRNPYKLFDRNCSNCGLELKTTYSEEKARSVYCEECYLSEVY